MSGLDNVGVAGYLVTESAVPPQADNPNWTSAPPSNYTVSSGGTYLLYPWFKDSVGNVSLYSIYKTAIVVPSSQTEFYVDQENGSDLASGTQAAPWKTLYYLQTILTKKLIYEGDTIYLKGGNVWRDSLYFSSDLYGITLTRYGDGFPEIRCTEIVEDWSNYSENIWSVQIEGARQVFFNSIRGKSESDLLELDQPNEWWLDSSTGLLYVYSALGAPSGVEISIRDGIHIDGSDNIVIDGLKIFGANNYAVGAFSGAFAPVVRNSQLLSSFDFGLWADDNGSGYVYGGTFENNEVRDCGKNGLFVGKDCENWLVKNNEASENSWQLLQEGDEFDGAAFMLSLSSAHMIENNHAHHNYGWGFWIKNCPKVWNWVSNCVANNNSQGGIRISGTSKPMVYYNLAYDNPGGAGVLVEGGSGAPTYGGVVYNNTLTGNLYGLVARGQEGISSGFYNNKFANNIVSGNAENSIGSYFGGENDGTMGYGNVYTHNLIGSDKSKLIRWGNAEFSSLPEWESAYGSNTYSVQLAPSYKSGGYEPTTGSSAIDAGTLSAWRDNTYSSVYDLGGTEIIDAGGIIKVDPIDIGAFEFVEESQTLRADFDSDNDVDIFDYNILLGNFGTTGDCGNPADVDGDCNVGIFDYNILLGEFGSGT